MLRTAKNEIQELADKSGKPVYLVRVTDSASGREFCEEECFTTDKREADAWAKQWRAEYDAECGYSLKRETIQPAAVETVQVPVKVSDQFCRDVLCTAVEGGSNYWAEFKVLRFVMGDYVQEYDRVRVFEIDEFTGNTVSKIDIGCAELRAGVVRLIAGGMTDNGREADAHARYRAQVLAAVLADDASDIDAELADLCMQAAALSCVRYG